MGGEEVVEGGGKGGGEGWGRGGKGVTLPILRPLKNVSNLLLSSFSLPLAPFRFLLLLFRLLISPLLFLLWVLGALGVEFARQEDLVGVGEEVIPRRRGIALSCILASIRSLRRSLAFERH